MHRSKNHPYSKSAQPTRRTSLKSNFPKRRSKSPSPTQGPKISRTTATRHQRNAAALILSSLVVDQQTKARDRQIAIGKTKPLNPDLSERIGHQSFCLSASL